MNIIKDLKKHISNLLKEVNKSKYTKSVKITLLEPLKNSDLYISIKNIPLGFPSPAITAKDYQNDIIENLNNFNIFCSDKNIKIVFCYQDFKEIKNNCFLNLNIWCNKLTNEKIYYIKQALTEYIAG